MQELANAIQSAFTTMVESGKLKAVIDTNIEKAVSTIIAEVFSYRSEFQDSLKKQIAQGLRIDFDNLGIPGYNQTVLAIVKTKLDAAIATSANKQIGENLEKLLETAPTEIRLTELLELFTEKSKEEFSSRRDREDYDISWHLVANKYTQGMHVLRLDPESNTLPDRCGYSLSLRSLDRKRKASQADEDEAEELERCEVWNIALPYQGDPTKKVFAGPLYGFDKLLFQMYHAKTVVILDEV